MVKDKLLTHWEKIILIMKTFKNGKLFNFTNVFGMVEMKKGFTLVELLVVVAILGVW